MEPLTRIILNPVRRIDPTDFSYWITNSNWIPTGRFDFSTVNCTVSGPFTKGADPNYKTPGKGYRLFLTHHNPCPTS